MLAEEFHAVFGVVDSEMGSLVEELENMMPSHGSHMMANALHDIVESVRDPMLNLGRGALAVYSLSFRSKYIHTHMYTHCYIATRGRQSRLRFLRSRL